MVINYKLVLEAADRIKQAAKISPLEYSKRLSEKYEANIYLKREDLQEVRSFKIRGAYNKIAALTAEEKARGVVCASAGNHAQGVAYACSRMETKGMIFMPVVTPNQKVNKVRKFGGSYIDIRLEGDTFDDAAKAAQEYCKANGMVFVHPFDDELVIAGQGTIAKEIHEQLEGKLDYVMVAIGGGGMIAGIASALKGIGSDAEVVGVETETQTAMYQSLQKGERISIDKLDTFVDGTAVKTPGEITFSIIKDTIKDIVLVREGQVAVDMIELYQNEGIVAEPAGALAISGLENVAEKIKGKTVVCIICGGNNDLLRYPEILERSLVYRGLKHYFLVEFAQKPGQLRMFLNDVLGPNDDIVLFEYIKKNNKEKGPALVGIELSDKKDIDPLLERLNIAGFKYTKLTQDSMLYQYLV